MNIESYIRQLMQSPYFMVSLVVSLIVSWWAQGSQSAPVKSGPPAKGETLRTLPHIAIGCAVVWAGSRLVRGQEQANAQLPPTETQGFPAGALAARQKAAIDFRQVAVGSMLPDLIDKTLRRYVVGGRLQQNDHLFGHTVLAHLPALLLGLAFARQGDPRLLAVGAAAFTHLAVDPIVREPRTLLWPLLGWEFPTAHGFGRAATLASQAAAATIIGAKLFDLWRTRRIRSLVLRGRL